MLKKQTISRDIELIDAISNKNTLLRNILVMDLDRLGYTIGTIHAGQIILADLESLQHDDKTRTTNIIKAISNIMEFDQDAVLLVDSEEWTVGDITSIVQLILELELGEMGNIQLVRKIATEYNQQVNVIIERAITNYLETQSE